MTHYKNATLDQLEAGANGPGNAAVLRLICKEAIDRARHTATDEGTFSWAVRGLKVGLRFARRGWNGTGMFIYLVPGATFEVNREPLSSVLGHGTKVEYRPHIDIKAADGTCAPWVASQADMLADDWEIV